MNLSDCREGDQVTSGAARGKVRCLLPAGYAEVTFADGNRVVPLAELERWPSADLVASLEARALLEEGDAAAERERLRIVARGELLRALEAMSVAGVDAVGWTEQAENLLEAMRAYLVDEASDAIESAAAE